MTVDQTRCPLCGDDNACGGAAGTTGCWCTMTTISPEALARVPDAAKNVVCICQACASGKRSAAEAQSKIDALIRGRG